MEKYIVLFSYSKDFLIDRDGFAAIFESEKGAKKVMDLVSEFSKRDYIILKIKLKN